MYRNKIESLSNSKNENTLIIAPDKNNLNKNCFQKLYNQDIKYNLNNDRVFCNESYISNYNHNFDKRILFKSYHSFTHRKDDIQDITICRIYLYYIDKKSIINTTI